MTCYTSVSSALAVMFALVVGGTSFIVAYMMGIVVLCAMFVYLTNPTAQKSIPSFKIAKVVPASPSEVFECLMSHENRPSWDASVRQYRIVEKMDEHSAIVHIILNPVWIWPIWLPARDLCLLRYWRQEADGSYIVCYQSAEHPECQPYDEYVRAFCQGGGFTIAPRTGTDNINSSLVTHVVHMDPMGWVRPLLLRFNLLFHYLKMKTLRGFGLPAALLLRPSQ